MFELSNLEVPFDCELLVAQWGGKVTRLSEVYRASPELPLQVWHFGDWSLGSHRNWPSFGLYRRRTSLDGHVIKAAILEDVRLYFQVLKHYIMTTFITCTLGQVLLV
jgi:hypothetical protein